jgi:transposase
MLREDGIGVGRRSWSLSARRRIVDEALSPGVSVASVARRHGVNANLIFKWIKRSREGWLDLRCVPNARAAIDVARPEASAPTFIPVNFLVLDAPPAATQTLPPSVSARSVRGPRRISRRGAMEIRLPNGACVSLDAEVDAAALRRVLSALDAL